MLLRHTVFGDESVYRVLARTRAFVHVEVVSAPGLERGTQLRLTPASASAMRSMATARPGRVRRRAAAGVPTAASPA